MKIFKSGIVKSRTFLIIFGEEVINCFACIRPSVVLQREVKYCERKVPIYSEIINPWRIHRNRLGRFEKRKVAIQRICWQTITDVGKDIRSSEAIVVVFWRYIVKKGYKKV